MSKILLTLCFHWEVNISMSPQALLWGHGKVLEHNEPIYCTVQKKAIFILKMQPLLHQYSLQEMA